MSYVTVSPNGSIKNPHIRIEWTEAISRIFCPLEYANGTNIHIRDNTNGPTMMEFTLDDPEWTTKKALNVCVTSEKEIHLQSVRVVEKVR